jgi:nucleoside 2-deoxyribosyltransferase
VIVKVFIAVRVPRSDGASEELIAAITAVLNDTGHTPFVAYQEIIRRSLAAGQFMPYVRNEISTSNIVLVVYSPDLRGGLIELGIAYALGVPVWLTARKDEPISTSAKACAERIINYSTVKELTSELYIAINEETGL